LQDWLNKQCNEKQPKDVFDRREFKQEAYWKTNAKGFITDLCESEQEGQHPLTGQREPPISGGT